MKEIHLMLDESSSALFSQGTEASRAGSSLSSCARGRLSGSATTRGRASDLMLDISRFLRIRNRPSSGNLRGSELSTGGAAELTLCASDWDRYHRLRISRQRSDEQEPSGQYSSCRELTRGSGSGYQTKEGEDGERGAVGPGYSVEGGGCYSSQDGLSHHCRFASSISWDRRFPKLNAADAKQAAELALARKNLVQSGLVRCDDPIVLAVQRELSLLVGGGGCDRGPSHAPVSDDAFLKLAGYVQAERCCSNSHEGMRDVLGSMLRRWEEEEPRDVITFEMLQDCGICEMRPLCESVKNVVHYLAGNPHHLFSSEERTSVDRLSRSLLQVIRHNKDRWHSLMKEVKQRCI